MSASAHPSEPGAILIVDDDPQVGRLLADILERRGFRCALRESAEAGRAEMDRNGYSLVLCDVQLPGESGLDFLREIPKPEVATLMISGLDSPDTADTALAMGAYGYITKPFKRADVAIGVMNALERRRLELENRAHKEGLEVLVAERTKELGIASGRLEEIAAELLRSRTETIWRLARAVEFRDEQTGGHIDRMSRYCGLLAERVGLDPEPMRIASSMHDAGKIAIPDAILLKPGTLTAAERKVMEGHARVGFLLLSDSESDLLELAATIALTHHERFDGTGYPRRLSGDAIPIVGRIAAIADVFDALTSDRVYRDAVPVEKAVEMMREQRGKHFCPGLLDEFLASLDEVLAIHAASSCGASASPAQRALRGREAVASAASRTKARFDRSLAGGTGATNDR